LFAIGEMAVNLAHEIKNPLGAIKGSAQILEESLQGSADREFVEIIKSETDRLSRVLNELLDYAKPRRYQPQKSCDVLEVIRHTTALCLGKGNVSFDIRGEGQTTLEADPEMLKQVLLNLFLNSIQAAEGQKDSRVQVLAREKRLGSSLAVWSASQRFIEIIVQDNGPGIPAALRERVFTPFFTTKPKGTGLGLAICRRLVESMGGTIQLSPHQKAGTSFVIHLPIREAMEEKRAPQTLITEFSS
jgi:signal transduction histidine kinase